MSPSPVYLDHAATTPVRPDVLEAMLPYLGPEAFGNPSSAHSYGRNARAGVEQARRQVAEAIGTEPGDVVFTSGGTEADNLAVLGTALAAQSRGGGVGATMHVVVTASEHKAILEAAHEVERLGGSSRVVPTGSDGLIDLAELDRALEERPAVVSVMWVNNETGVVQPVDAVAERCEDRGVLFHTDAVQAIGKLPVSLALFRSIMLTISGHKIGAPKGVGALIVRDRNAIRPLVHGGGQQSGVRPGTENVAGIVGLGRAVELAVTEQGEEAARLGALRDDLASRLASGTPDLMVLAEASPRAPHILNVAVPGTDSEAMLMHLDLAGVAASSGSACTTGSVEPSHVLSAMNVPRPLALAALRFSFGHESTPDDVSRAAQVVPRCVEKVRRLAGVLGRG
jgi:cysteine desulfurase